MVARLAHNQQVGGSIPSLATKTKIMVTLFIGILVGFFACHLVNRFLGSTQKLNEEIESIIDEIDNSITLEEVENKNKKGSADSTYWLLSKGEDKYLFTSEQLKTAKNRALKNPEDIN